MMTLFRRNEDGAAMPMAIGLAFLLTFSIMVLSLFVLTGVEHEKYAFKANQSSASQQAVYDEILNKINTNGGINVSGKKNFIGSSTTNKQTSSDGMFEWWVESPSSGKYQIVLKPSLQSEKATDAASETRRPLVAKPVSAVYPATNAKNSAGDPAMLYEPFIENGMFGYFQSSFHSLRLGDVDAATEKNMAATTGEYQQVLRNVKMRSYNSASSSDTTAASRGAWTTSMNFADPTKVDPNETVSNVTANQEKFTGVDRSLGTDSVADPRPASKAPGSSLGERQYYTYDLSFDLVDNQAVINCPNPTATWRASTAPSVGVLDPAQNGGCWKTMIFDRNTTVVANTSSVIYAENIVIGQTVKVNKDKDASHLRLVNFGTGGFKMSHGSDINGMVMVLGQQSCNISGVGGLASKVYGSLVCTNAYKIDNAEFWWDTNLETKYLNQTLPAGKTLNRMWEYGA